MYLIFPCKISALSNIRFEIYAQSRKKRVNIHFKAKFRLDLVHITNLVTHKIGSSLPILHELSLILLVSSF